jgi:exportin-1
MALEGAQQLLDFSQKLDINLLDNVIKTMYHGSGTQVCS